MALILVIPDVHLKPKIFDRAEKILESGQADYCVSLGDIVDDWDEEFNIPLYEKTLNRALKFYEKFPNTIWVEANHDFGYRNPVMGRKQTGHSHVAELSVAPLIEGIPQQICYIVDNVIFTHAGLTEDWVEDRLRKEGLTGDGLSDEEMASIINRAFPVELWNKKSPIWARPLRHDYAMFSDKMQVVGHTPVEKIDLVDNVLYTDVFSTYSNGAPIGEQRFAIVDTEKKEWHYAREDEWIS